MRMVKIDSRNAWENLAGGVLHNFTVDSLPRPRESLSCETTSAPPDFEAGRYCAWCCTRILIKGLQIDFVVYMYIKFNVK